MNIAIHRALTLSLLLPLLHACSDRDDAKTAPDALSPSAQWGACWSFIRAQTTTRRNHRATQATSSHAASSKPTDRPGRVQTLRYRPKRPRIRADPIMNRHLSRPIRALASLFAVVAMPSSAQPAIAGAPAAAPVASIAERYPVSDDKLRQFIAATYHADAVQEEFTIRTQMLMLQAQMMQQYMLQKLVKNVESTGITMDEYVAIYRSVQDDPQLAARIERLQQP
jgi:hypothetical protein